MTPRPRKVYISGPMSGHADNNHPAFFDAEEALVARGYEVVNPAAHDTPEDLAAIASEPMHGPTWDRLVSHDLDLIADPAVGIEALVMLPGFPESRGARREMAKALALGKHLLLLEDVLADEVAA